MLPLISSIFFEEQRGMRMRYFLGIIISFFFFQNAFSEQSLNTIFTGSREGDPASIVKNVSTIHGDYSELEIDLCIPGPDPLIVSRFYTSKDTLDVARFGGWRFHPQTFFLIGPKQNEKLNIYIGMLEGSILKTQLATYIALEHSRTQQVGI